MSRSTSLSPRRSRRPRRSSCEPPATPSRRPGVQKVGRRFALADLPALPKVVTRLLALDPRAASYFDDVVTLAMEDPPLCARVIAAANTCASAPAVPIVELRPAVARLGVTQVSGIVTAAAITEMFGGRGATRLWWHALLVAAVSRCVAEHLQRPGITPSTAYLAGLLHDIGRFIMYADDAGSLDEVAAARAAGLIPLVILERERFGFDHAQLGAEACRQWGFPELLMGSIRHHHALDLEDPRWDDNTGWLVRMVHVADLLVSHHLDDADFLAGTQGEQRFAIEQTMGAALGNLVAPAVKQLDAIVADVEGLGAAVDLPPRRRAQTWTRVQAPARHRLTNTPA